MRFDVLTLFCGMFSTFLKESILGRAVERGLLDVHLVDIRDYASDAHKTTDDRPYGGGDGMVMKPEPIYEAIRSVERVGERSRVILLSPQGEVFDQQKAWELSELDQLVLVCGRYEGVDERAISSSVDQELSIGDYILSGGETAAMVVMESVGRLIPKVLGGERSTLEDSFEDGLLEYPQYTRPREFKGQEVPEVLLSGDHEAIRRWRREQSMRRTLERRPDLLEKAGLSEEDRTILAGLQEEP